MRRHANAAARRDLAAAQHAYQVVLAHEQGWQNAVRLCQHLASGRTPWLVPGVSPEGEPIYLNAVFDCFSWRAINVVPNERPVAAFGSPLFVAAAVALGTAANRREHARAEALSRPQWRSHGRWQVLVTPTATWCGRGGEWLCYPHAMVAGYELVQDGCTMQFRDGTPPLRLVGTAVWCHAVLLAYAQYGPDRYLQAPYLERLRNMALQFPMPVG